LPQLQQAHNPVWRVLHEGGHGAAGRTFAALETAPNRSAGKLLHLSDHVDIHGFLRNKHLLFFHRITILARLKRILLLIF
jgi:hypothetical protein